MTGNAGITGNDGNDGREEWRKGVLAIPTHVENTLGAGRMGDCAGRRGERNVDKAPGMIPLRCGSGGQIRLFDTFRKRPEMRENCAIFFVNFG